MCSHLLNYQFAKNFWIKKVCRLLAHIDQRSPWAFIFIIIAFYFLWFWQNRVWDLSLSLDYQGMSGPNSDQERSSVRTGVRSSWCKHPEYRRWERDHAGGGGVSPMAERSFESPVTPQPPPRLLHIDHSLTNILEISETWGRQMLVWRVTSLWIMIRDPLGKVRALG